MDPAAGPVRIAEARQVAPGDHERVLQGILGRSTSRRIPRDREAAVAMKTDPVDECLLVAALRRLDEIPIHPTVRLRRARRGRVLPYR
jgi:hypothetical protein